MEGRFEVTVMDRKTGKLAEYAGLKAQVQTSFGILCAMVGEGEYGSAFMCQLLGDEDTGLNLKQIHNMFKAVFHLFGEIADSSGHATDVHAAVSSAFVHFLEDAHGKKQAAFILHELSLIPTLGEGEEA
jgi:hypothetical protein